MVTALDGKTLPGVLVKASGPVDREAETDPSGLVMLANMTPGTYRLRFEHEGYITFEKEVSLAAGKPLRASAALSAAPPPPAPPKPEPAPPAPVTPAADSSYSPSSVAILDFLERNFIGGAPARRSPLGCTGSTTSTLVQTREPLDEHVHGDTDEIIYVLAGEATHRIEGREQQIGSNTFLVIPRGVPHSLVRRGRNPLTLITILAGQPCQGGK
jgi:Carboxypeptidase regulatory-like domain/Cupin domain